MKSKNGFTLIELLIVIGIIAVLGGVMMATFSGSTESAMAVKCLNNMRSLCNAVQAAGAKETYYPAAGPYQYLELGSSRKRWHQGWIGHAEGDKEVSAYYSPRDPGDDQYYAITNGTIWKAMKGHRSAYACPTHIKHCKRNALPTPAWTYVMNSYFGWNYGTAAEISGGLRKYGDGSFAFSYSSAPTSRRRPIEKTLLFAEMPYVNNGVQHPDWSTSAGMENDMTLQYANDTGGSPKANKSVSGGSPESIGFNHKVGRAYVAHVAFADGHCVKITLSDYAKEDDLQNLTTWLCTGQEYTFNGGKYEKAGE